MIFKTIEMLFINPTKLTQVHVDIKRKVVSTPAYMCDTKVHLIHDGVGNMVKNVLQLVNN